MKHLIFNFNLKNEEGAVAVIVAILMIVFIGIAALVIDLGHLYVVKNELQNAADAGALAGARMLYTEDGTWINVDANNVAVAAAEANRSDNAPVEVENVERGHWQFSTSTFTPNSSTDIVDLIDVSNEELDANIEFINAVRVTTKRSNATSFFATIFGFKSFEMRATAVAYLGFTGTIDELGVDQPIAICMESIINETEYNCHIGRMINSGGNDATNETGGWTDFNQNDPYNGTIDHTTVENLINSDGNPNPIIFGKVMATNNGEKENIFKEFRQRWKTESNDFTQSWKLTLPVISCPSNHVNNWSKVMGAVVVDVVWVTESGEDPKYTKAPKKMDDWDNNNPDGGKRWKSFVKHFGLTNVDGSDAPYAQKSIYFKPSCNPQKPEGTTGAYNFGILAEIPVLVQ